MAPNGIEPAQGVDGARGVDRPLDYAVTVADDLRERVRTGLGIIALAISVSAATDLWFLRWQRPTVQLAELAQLTVVVLAYAALRRAAREQVVWITTVAACLLYTAMGAAGIASSDASTTPLELNALTVGTASLLPWGTWPQIITVAVAAVITVANVVAVRGGLDLPGVYPVLVAAAIAYGASVYIANKLARARASTAETERQRDDAARALRAAHADLERRVAQRTAQLQVVNRALEIEIAERRQLEETVREHEARLAQAARLSSVGQMAAEIAHELNQPLGAIANFARGCTRHLESNTAPTNEIIDTIEEIAAQALRAGRIIRRIASVTRKPATSPDTTDVNDLVHGVARFMAAELHRLGVTLHLDLTPELPMVQADRLQIEEVLVNLMRNGCEAMDGCAGARELSISTTSVAPSVVAVAVRDTGAGLAPEIAAHIFAPFYSTKPYGVGLGLSISRSIVDAHGGDLQAINDGNRGSTFQFTLPASSRQSDPVSARHRPEPQ